MTAWWKPPRPKVGDSVDRNRGWQRLRLLGDDDSRPETPSSLAYASKYPTERFTGSGIPNKALETNINGNISQLELIPLGLDAVAFREWEARNLDYQPEGSHLLSLNDFESGTHFIHADSPWRKLFSLYGIELKVRLVNEFDSPFRFYLRSVCWEDKANEGFHALVSFKEFERAFRKVRGEVKKFGFSSPFYEARFIVTSLYSAMYGHKIIRDEFIEFIPEALKDDGKQRLQGWGKREEVLRFKVEYPELWKEDISDMPLDYLRGLYGGGNRGL